MGEQSKVQARDLRIGWLVSSKDGRVRGIVRGVLSHGDLTLLTVDERVRTTRIRCAADQMWNVHTHP